jgi:hypothetical protein
MKVTRPTQQLPAEISDSLLACIGEMFYPERRSTPGERKRWAQVSASGDALFRGISEALTNQYKIDSLVRNLLATNQALAK